MKKIYVCPETVLIYKKEIPQLLAGSPQSPDADAKQSDFCFDSEEDNTFSNVKESSFDPWK